MDFHCLTIPWPANELILHAMSWVVGAAFAITNPKYKPQLLNYVARYQS